MAKRGRKAKDNKGYLDINKDNFTDYKVIRGNNITMEGVSGNIYAIPIDSKGNAGPGRLMKPGENHTFEGASNIIEVPEVAMAQTGLNTGMFDQRAWQRMGTSIWESMKMQNRQPNLTPNLQATTTNPNLTPPPNATQRLGNVLDNNQPQPTPSLLDLTANVEGTVGNLPPTPTPRGQVDTLMSFESYGVDPVNEPITDVVQGPSPTDGLTTSTQNLEQEYANRNRPQAVPSTIEPTQRIQFDNPYRGVSIPSAAQALGASLSYEGDQGTANTFRGVGAGLKLLTGLGRNIMSGYAQNVRNQHVVDDYNRKARNQSRGTVQSLQEGGNITDQDLLNINNTTGIDFNSETANQLFTHTPQQPNTQDPTVDFGRYRDLGYFREGEMQNGRRVIYNTDRNPMNYQDNVRNAMNYLRQINNPDSFEFRYVNSNPTNRTQNNQIVSRQKGGEVTASELLSGAYITGNENEVPNVEVEAGEHIKDNRTGQVQEVIGKKHNQGGEQMNLEDHRVLSDHTKIGGKLAKKYRDEYDIKVKAKDTYSTVMDKVLKKTGYTSLTEEMTSTIEQVQEQQDIAPEIDSEATTNINMQYLSGKINDLQQNLQPLEEMKSRVFETLFEDQQNSKSPKELREEQQEMQGGGETRVRIGDNPNTYTNPDNQPLTNASRYIAGTVNDENYIETVLNLLEEFPTLVQENFEIIQEGNQVVDITPRDGQESIVNLQRGINQVYEQRIEQAQQIQNPQERQRIINLIEQEKFTTEDRYKKIDGLIGNFTASRRNIDFGISQALREQGDTAITTTTETPSQGGNNNVDRRTLFLPDQTPLSPTAMQPHRLGEITPRETEASLISPDALLEEINRQAMTARRQIDSLPDSQRRAALAQLNSQTQQQINRVMTETAQANAQIQNQNTQANAQRAAQADIQNEELAENYERKTLTALDRTQQDINNFFNTLNRQQIANYNTVQSLNLTNAMYDNFQYDGNGSVIQTGKGPDLRESINYYLRIGLSPEEATKRAQEEQQTTTNTTSTAKRGRKIK